MTFYQELFRSSAASPKRMARATGIVYLLTIATGAVADSFVSNNLAQLSAASATATNDQNRYLVGYAIYVMDMLVQIAMTVMFYLLLKPVSRSVSLIFACLGIVACVIK